MKPLAVRVLLAALAFAGVAWLPDLVGLGPSGAASDLGLGALLGAGSVLAFAVAFAGGVLTSLTPCVYPLIPITVSIFGARKASGRGEAMALARLKAHAAHLDRFRLAPAGVDAKPLFRARTGAEYLGRLETLLAEARQRRGTIELELPERKIAFGPDGRPTGIQRRERLASHMLSTAAATTI